MSEQIPDPGDLHRARLELHDEEDSVPDQAAEGQDLDGGRVGRRQGVPMSGEKRLPGRLRSALRCGRDAVVYVDCFDRIPANLVAEALQATADARVAPGGILVRHAYHKRSDVWLGRRATGASLVGTVVFLGDELPVPPQDGVGCHDARDHCKAASAKDLAFHGQAASLVVGEARPSGSVRGAEDPVLLEQVVNDRLLLPANPAETSRRRKASGRGSESMGKRVAAGRFGSRCAG